MKYWGNHRKKKVCAILLGGAAFFLAAGSSWHKNQALEENKEEMRYVSNMTVTEKPKVALTFDDGPNPEWTPALLKGLEERGVKATFFLIGKNAEENKALVEQMEQAGHLIGNHTYSHVEIAKLSDEQAYEEIEQANEVLQAITGKRPEYMRPPFGSWQKELEKKVGMFPVLWTVDPLDWTTKDVTQIVNKVVTQTKENDIILMHDCYQSSVEAALQIIDILSKAGYEFVTVDELILD